MQSGILKRWLSHFRKYYFTYRKGFYHFPYNGNSPETMVNRLKGLPFVTHSAERQYVTTSTPMMSGGFHYRKLEEGCWLIYSKMRYKVNIAFDLAHDDEFDNDYYMLSLNDVSNQTHCYTEFHEGAIPFPRYSWTFFKPRIQNSSMNFKGDNSRFITLFFNERWLQENLASTSPFREGGIDRFLNSDASYILWPVDEPDFPLERFPLFDWAMNVNSDNQSASDWQLKSVALQLIFDFFSLCKKQRVVEKHRDISYYDRFKLTQVSNYLNNHLFEKFPGLDFLSEKFDISKTELKDDFKQLYGKPAYQYFRMQQMYLAKTLLVDNMPAIGDLAHRFGYESQGKFSTAFKKVHGVLPSELQRH